MTRLVEVACPNLGLGFEAQSEDTFQYASGLSSLAGLLWSEVEIMTLIHVLVSSFHESVVHCNIVSAHGCRHIDCMLAEMPSC